MINVPELLKVAHSHKAAEKEAAREFGARDCCYYHLQTHRSDMESVVRAAVRYQSLLTRVFYSRKYRDLYVEFDGILTLHTYLGD